MKFTLYFQESQIYRNQGLAIKDVSSGSGRSPREGKWRPTPIFLPGEFHRQRSLPGHSPWGRKESDTAEQLTLRGDTNRNI